MRELHEEVGLSLRDEAVLGLLDDYPTRSGYLITPVVVWGGHGSDLRPNPAEVESVHRFTLAEILGADAVSFESIPQSDRPIVRMHLGRYTINPPTAAVLYQFREVLQGRMTRVAHFEQPVFAWR